MVAIIEKRNWKRTVAKLCTLCVLFLAVHGCNKQEEPVIVHDDWDGIRVNILSAEELPKWLQTKIEKAWGDYVERGVDLPFYKTRYEIYRCVRNNSVNYLIFGNWSGYLIFSENGDGDNIPLSTKERSALIEESKNWELLFQISGGVVMQSSNEVKEHEFQLIKNTVTYPVNEDDEYEYPITPGTDEWYALDIPERVQVSQLPDDVLAKISTAGLLETYLKYPFLIELRFGNGHQQSFKNMSVSFNGLGELLKRPDLPDVLINKFLRNNDYLKDLPSMSQVEGDLVVGDFHYKSFVLGLIAAQDVVFLNLSREQEETLFWLTEEKHDIMINNPDLFGNLHTTTTGLLGARLIMRHNLLTSGYTREDLVQFILKPGPSTQNVINYHIEIIKRHYNK